MNGPQIGVVSAKTLFDPKNNPALRMDAGFGLALQKLADGTKDPSPRDTIRGLFKSQSAWREWIKPLREKTTLEEVKIHIARAFGHPDYSKMSEPVQTSIHAMAIRLCEQEAEIIENELATQLGQIERLRTLG